ncbi:MAG: hypothetical protein Q9168_000085 [Polycauliona sp. 1 TL-2023]
MEGSERIDQKQGDQMGTSVDTKSLAAQEEDQLKVTPEQDSPINGKTVHEDTHKQKDVSAAEIDTQSASRISTETLIETHGSPDTGEAHDQAASKEPKAAQKAEAAQVVPPAKAKTPAPEICATCLKVARVKCAECKCTWYCSRDCQRTDWTFHKHLCRDFKNFQTRPKPDCVRGILFPEDDKAPKFVWLKQNDEDGLDLEYVIERFEFGEVETLLSTPEGAVTQQYAAPSARRDKGTENSTARLYLLHRENPHTDGSRPNMSVGWVTKGKFQFSWWGPMVAVLTQFDDSEESENEAVLDDVSMVDFRDLIDFFGSYGRLTQGFKDYGAYSFWWLPQPLRDELDQQRQIKIVDVASDIDHKRSGIKYQEGWLAEGHPAMAFLSPCAVSVSLGLPLVLRRKAVDDDWTAKVESDGHRNHGAHLLLLDVDPKSPHWGATIGFAEQGTVMLMRHDGKDLHRQHAETILMYLVQVVGEAMMESVAGRRSKGEVLDLMHPSRLDWYFNKYRKQKAEQDQSWKDVPPLFDMGTTLAQNTRQMAGLGL